MVKYTYPNRKKAQIMINPKKLSSTLKDRADFIVQSTFAARKQNGALMVLSGVIFMVGGFITAVTDFEYLWYAMLIGFVLGIPLLVKGLALSNNQEIPSEALQLYGISELLRRSDPEPTPAPQTEAAPQPTTAPKPISNLPAWKLAQMQQEGKNQPTENNNNSYLYEHVPTWKRLQMEKENQEKQ